MTAPDDTKLAEQIVNAMKEYDAADATRKEKAVVAGKLLAEAQRRHPDQKAFEKFLESAGGIQLRRAQELIAIALGRKDFEQHQAENVAKQQRHRDKLKAEKIEREKAKAALPKPEPPKGKGKPEPKPKPDALRNASAASLREIETTCLTCFPKLNIPDLEKADKFFRNLMAHWRHSATRKKAA
jgi:hypothetical protein